MNEALSRHEMVKDFNKRDLFKTFGLISEIQKTNIGSTAYFSRTPIMIRSEDPISEIKSDKNLIVSTPLRALSGVPTAKMIFSKEETIPSKRKKILNTNPFKCHYAKILHADQEIIDEEIYTGFNTPGFESISDPIQELKEVCDKLVVEQQQIKEQISLQKLIIEKLSSHNLYQQPNRDLGLKEDFRKSSNQADPLLEKQRSSSSGRTRIAKLLNFPGNFDRFFQGKPKLQLHDLSYTERGCEFKGFPTLAGAQTEKNIYRFSAKKYSRDQPVVSRNLRIFKPKLTPNHK